MPGTTHLLTGWLGPARGRRREVIGFDESERADSIMLVNVAPNGAYLLRFRFPATRTREIPGVGWDKINAPRHGGRSCSSRPSRS